MEYCKKGDTLFFPRPPVAAFYAAVGGKKEGEGPLHDCFDRLFEDNSLGEDTWEKSESALQRRCVETLLQKAKLTLDQLDFLLAGDLQNQCTASGYTLRGLDVPFVGLYGACSTMTEGLGLAAALVAGGMARRAAALASSHFCAAERQFRGPLEYGGKRTPTAQWTVTGAGSVLVTPKGNGPFIRAVTFGRVRDYQITDISNMGAAMAPAAAETILRYLADSGTKPQQFDAIYTGDLGQVGSRLLAQLLEREGVVLPNHRDCGLMIYSPDQDVQAGGSGCGCSASVLAGLVLPELRKGRQRRVLFLSTGALMSQTTFLQGESIPGVAHLVELSATPKEEWK